ncbi:MAG: N,N'-diacetyllegionaminate synthase [Salibacteraceae bacterium]
MIIAEAGVNHNGDKETAKKLIKCAKDCGADYIKFQLFNPDLLVAPNTTLAAYQKANTAYGDQHEMLKKLSLDQNDFREIFDYARALNFPITATPFDYQSLNWLIDAKVELIKISSGDITHKPLLERVAKSSIPTILSSGNSTLDELKDAMGIFDRAGFNRENLAMLQCTSQYPTPFNEVNLRAIETISQELNVASGLSDHTPGIEIPIAAAALGAQIIEKHFTLDKTLSGPDHKASIDPSELADMIAGIRHVESALGSGEKKPQESEIQNKEVVRRSIYFRKDLGVGSKVTPDDLIMLRPGFGISPMHVDDFIGCELRVNVNKFQLLDRSLFK